jgi:hypothetical protein
MKGILTWLKSGSGDINEHQDNIPPSSKATLLSPALLDAIFTATTKVHVTALVLNPDSAADNTTFRQHIESTRSLDQRSLALNKCILNIAKAADNDNRDAYATLLASIQDMVTGTDRELYDAVVALIAPQACDIHKLRLAVTAMKTASTTNFSALKLMTPKLFKEAVVFVMYAWQRYTTNT